MNQFPIRAPGIEEAQAEYTRGNIDVFELERRITAVLQREGIDKIQLPHAERLEEGMDMESARIAGGLVLASVAAFITLVVLAILAFGVAGIIVYLISG